MNGFAEISTTIRTAVMADLPELQRVYRAASLSNVADAALLLARPESLIFGGERIAERGTRLAVAGPDHGGHVLGFATLSVNPDGLPELDDLFVDPGWRRRGVARRLVLDVVHSVRQANHRRLWATGNPHALAFYLAVGFVVEREPVTTQLGAGLRLHLDVTCS